jgi:hypothetical protein
VGNCLASAVMGRWEGEFHPVRRNFLRSTSVVGP